MATAIGTGRFAYTPILPGMAEDLGWSNTSSGAVASANLLGYLIGATISIRKLSPDITKIALFLAIVACVSCSIAMAYPNDEVEAAAIRLVAGIGSAVVLIRSSEIVVDHLAGKADSWISVHFSGVGAGVLLSVGAIQVAEVTDGGWRTMWLYCGALSLTLGSLAFVLLAPAMNYALSSMLRRVSQANCATGRLAASYGLVGAGYITAATFLISGLRRGAADRAEEAFVWAAFGGSAMVSVLVWRGLADRIGRFRAYSIACYLQAAGIAGFVLFPGGGGGTLAAIGLGSTLLGITTLGIEIARSIPDGDGHANVARVTTAFALGQAISPWLAGLLFDTLGGLEVPMLLSSAALLIAGVLVGNAGILPEDALHK